jgi:hypothetical protein
MTDDDVSYFHPEDELLLENGEHVSFPFANQSSSEEGNVKTSGLLLLIERSKFERQLDRWREF